MQIKEFKGFLTNILQIHYKKHVIGFLQESKNLNATILTEVIDTQIIFFNQHIKFYFHVQIVLQYASITPFLTLATFINFLCIPYALEH